MTGRFFKLLWKCGVVYMMVSCGYQFPFGYPTKHNYMNKSPEGPPAFQYGWSQGCRMGVSGWSSQFYSGVGQEKFGKDFRFAANNPDYEIAWQIAFWYCMRGAERFDGRKRDKYAGL